MSEALTGLADCLHIINNVIKEFFVPNAQFCICFFLLLICFVWIRFAFDSEVTENYRVRGNKKHPYRHWNPKECGLWIDVCDSAILRIIVAGSNDCQENIHDNNSQEIDLEEVEGRVVVFAGSEVGE